MRGKALGLAWRAHRLKQPHMKLTHMQVVLILAVIALVPRSSPLQFDKATTIDKLRHTPAAGATHTKYAIVFDAGSTGSRIHVFKFEQHGSSLKLISDTFEQLKPGLSSFADDPKKAAESLKPLLATAIKTVPAELQVRRGRACMHAGHMHAGTQRPTALRRADACTAQCAWRACTA